jgi:hypothetical protein
MRGSLSTNGARLRAQHAPTSSVPAESLAADPEFLRAQKQLGNFRREATHGGDGK